MVNEHNLILNVGVKVVDQVDLYNLIQVMIYVEYIKHIYKYPFQDQMQ
jgi:hypothetical protein